MVVSVLISDVVVVNCSCLGYEITLRERKSSST